MQSNKPPDEPVPAEADKFTTTGSFVVDEVMGRLDRDRPLVSIVLPAFNEASILREHVVHLLNYLRTLNRRFRFELIVVNDGSSDQTGTIADQLATEFAGIRAFHHRRNFGLGQALKQIGQRDRARTHLRLAVALAPDSRLYRDALARLG